ncbi:MAG: class I SAM-dependent methyltransferase [Peptococcaceae bacterium]|nr:class I SAM-dependent methyltransferase [Peptococcaceae bacterium]
MSTQQASFTALMSAFIRGYHSRYDQPKIFDDFLAYDLLTEDEKTGIAKHLANGLSFFAPELTDIPPDQESALAIVMRAMSASLVLSRSRYTEDCLEKAIKNGVRQYIILGAGMDTFAFRRPELLTELTVFELDHPATQASKLERIRKQGWNHPSNLHFVPVDFQTKNLDALLENPNYHPEQLSFFSWLGVSYYLTIDEVFANLRVIAQISPAESIIAFDYQDSDALIPEKTAERTKKMQQLAQGTGEPMKSGFDPTLLAQNFRMLGLHLRENLSPCDIQQRYFEGLDEGYYAFEHVHFAKAIIS